MENFLTPLIHQEKLNQDKIISLIGAGGKTTLLYQLGQLLSTKKNILLTTTTHMAYPDHLDSSQIITEENIIDFPKNQSLLFLGKPEGHKVASLSHDFLYEALSYYDQMIVEADGSKRLPAKIKNTTEPVILKDCSCVIQVVGLSALNHPIEDVLFRYPIACEVFDLNKETMLTIDLLKEILLYNFNNIDCEKKILLFNQIDQVDLTQIEPYFKDFPYPVYYSSLKNNILKGGQPSDHL